MNEMTEQPIRMAATVIIARDAAAQYEILMLKRTNQAVFAGGMYVFPGGKVDSGDGHEKVASLSRGPSEDQVGQTAAVGDQWQHFWLAGIRETFEESGLLLAYDKKGDLIQFDDSNEARFGAHRQRVFDGEMTMVELCELENLELAFDRIHFYNRLITPPGRPRRFDTHFFITTAPSEQQGLHDGLETVDSIWISPADALRLNLEGEFGMMGATQRQLNELKDYTTVSDLLEMATTRSVFPTHAYARIPTT